MYRRIEDSSNQAVNPWIIISALVSIELFPLIREKLFLLAAEDLSEPVKHIAKAWNRREYLY